jgi:hypothetical protein
MTAVILCLGPDRFDDSCSLTDCRLCNGERYCASDWLDASYLKYAACMLRWGFALLGGYLRAAMGTASPHQVHKPNHNCTS